MFTGIISHLGKLKGRDGSFYIFTAQGLPSKKLVKGTSIAINGVCLTVVGKAKINSFTVEIMPETKVKTMLGKLKIGALVNLELPATPQSLLSGHIIQGHIDGVARLEEIVKEGNSRILKFSIPKNLAKYIVAKGSVAVNGISLTAIEVGKGYFTVGIIPYTWDHTMLHTLNLGDLVNIELDVLAKYVEKLMHK